MNNTKIVREIGGKQMTVKSGGTLKVENGGSLILPTADPHIAGALWNNSGTVTVSAG